MITPNPPEPVTQCVTAEDLFLLVRLATHEYSADKKIKMAERILGREFDVAERGRFLASYWHWYWKQKGQHYDAGQIGRFERGD
jgi:hypothetical protein